MPNKAKDKIEEILKVLKNGKSSKSSEKVAAKKVATKSGAQKKVKKSNSKNVKSKVDDKKEQKSSATKNVAKKDSAVKVPSKKTVSEKTTAKKTATKKASAKSKATVKSVTKKVSTANVVAKKSANTKKSTSVKKPITKSKATVKSTTKKAEPTKTLAKSKTSTKKATAKNEVASNTTAKKTPAKKATSTKKANTVKKATSAKKPITKSKTATKKANKKTSSRKTQAKNLNIEEYYDLPNKYEQTIVKILAQTPTILFVYWEISSKDRNKFIKEYGENFFNETSPYLIVINKDKNYQFEVEINDYANSWYLHIPDSDCKYEVILSRKNKNSQILPQNSITIISSNQIETPNDHILFEKLGKTIFFKDVKSGYVQSKDISSFAFMHNIGRIYNIYDLYKEIYKNELNGDELGIKLSSSQFSSNFK